MPRQRPTLTLRPATRALIERELRDYQESRQRLREASGLPPRQRAELARTVQAIESVYARLLPRARLLVALHYWTGWKVSEVAPLLGLSAIAAGRWRTAIIEALAAELGWW